LTKFLQEGKKEVHMSKKPYVLTQKQKDRHNLMRRLRRSRNKEKTNAESKAWRDANKEKYKDCRKKSHQKYKEIRNLKSKNWRLINPEKVKENNLKNVVPQKKIFQEKANFYKLQHGCIDCGYKDHAVALHFDHVYGEKVKDISLYHKWELALPEIEKCVVRCANCHAIKTFEKKEYRGWRNKNKKS
jgi:hypothetical protein